MKGRLQELKEKLIVFGIITAIFLPVRMIFYTYFSSHWVGSLGLASSLMFILIFLAHKQKLGRFGTLFLGQMTKTINGKTGKVAIIFSLILIAYFGSTLVWIERGNTIYFHEKKILSQILFSNYGVEMSTNDINEIINIHKSNKIMDVSNVNYADQIISLTYAIMNDKMGGWMINLDMIFLVEQFEFLGFILVYRKVYQPSSSIMVTL